MAADPKLIVALEARLNKFEKDLKQAGVIADRQVSGIERRFSRANRNIASSVASLTAGVRTGLGALGIGLGVREIQRFADSFTSIQNALKVAGLEGAELTRVYDALFASAQKNAAPVQELAVLYSRVALAQKELNVTNAELLEFADKVSLALRVSGKSATESAGALLQLSQAMSGGIIQAQEYNSLIDGAQPILLAVAAGLEDAGGSVAKLTRLVKDQKVSSQAFFQAFLAGSATLEDRARGMQLTIGQAFTQFFNALTDVVGRVDKVTGASQEAVTALREFSAALSFIAGNIETIRGPYQEVAKLIRGVGEEAHWAAKIVARLNSLTIPGIATNIGGFVGRKIAGMFTGASPEEAAEAEREAARGRALSGLPAPKAASQTVKLSDFPIVGGSKKGKGNTLGVDSFERALANAQKQIDVLDAETAAIDLNTAARERAKLVAELETAAKAANAAEGLKNTEVTVQQATQIQALADQFYAVSAAAEAARNPLAEFAREARNTTLAAQEVALSGIQSLEDALVDVITRTQDAKEAFRNMANAILADLARLAIRQAITGPIAGLLGGGGIFGGFRASGGPVAASTPYVVGERGPEIFVPKNAGNIVPNNIARKGGAGGGITVVVQQSNSFQAGMTPTDMAAINSQLERTKAETKRETIEAIRVGQRNNSSFISG